jgi:hypothetical protein
MEGRGRALKKSSSLLPSSTVLAFVPPILLNIVPITIIHSNSLAQPLAILLSVPSALVGVVLGLLITGVPLGLITFLVALTRIVVRALYFCSIRDSPGQRGVDRTYSNSAVLHKMKGLYWILIFLLLSVGQIESVQAAPASPSGAAPLFPKPVEEYHDEQIPAITAKLVQRIQAEPFNLVGTLIFLGAIIHTFLASKFMLIAHRLEHQYHALEEQEKDTSDNKELFRMRDGLQFRAQFRGPGERSRQPRDRASTS